MPFGFGPGSEMMKSYQQNRNMKQVRRSLKENTEIYSSTDQPDNNLNRQELKPEHLEAIRDGMKEHNRKELFKTLFAIGLALGVLVWLYFGFIA